MPLRASLLALMLWASAATAAELKTLKGEIVKGDVVSINATEIVLDVAGDKQSFSVKQIAGIDFAAPPKAVMTAYHDVELTDGTLLHCSELQFQGTAFNAKLMGAEIAVKIPMSAVANVLWDAQDANRRKAWADRLAHPRNFDAFGVIDGDIINMLEVTILSADEKGETIAFQKGDLKGKRKQGSPLVGLYFQRRLNPNAPAVACKLTDLGMNNVMVADVEAKDDALHFKTSCGVTLTYKPVQLVRLDYSSSNLAYLSDLTPSSVTETSTEERIEHYRKDVNMEGRPIRLHGATYSKGLALHATTELEFKLKGEYRTLQGIAGIDYQVGGHNKPMVLKLIADETVIFEKNLLRDDPKADYYPFTLNVKDVKLLKIVVTSSESDPFRLDLGLNLDLADIRVIK